MTSPTVNANRAFTNTFGDHQRRREAAVREQEQQLPAAPAGNMVLRAQPQAQCPGGLNQGLIRYRQRKPLACELDGIWA